MRRKRFRLDANTFIPAEELEPYLVYVPLGFFDEPSAWEARRLRREGRYEAYSIREAMECWRRDNLELVMANRAAARNRSLGALPVVFDLLIMLAATLFSIPFMLIKKSR